MTIRTKELFYNTKPDGIFSYSADPDFYVYLFKCAVCDRYLPCIVHTYFIRHHRLF